MSAESNELISPEELNGTWTYECTVLTGGQGEMGFPDEFINGNIGSVANKHGGVVDFTLVKNEQTGINHVEVHGSRLWRRKVDADGNILDEEYLKKPKTWTDINFSLVYPEDMLLYQYEIENTGVTGITNVHIVRNHESGNLVMEGWFYYVPSSKSLNEMQDIKPDEVKYKVRAQKENQRWLAIFGEVKLKKEGGK